MNTTKFFTIDSETMSIDAFGKILSMSVAYFDTADEPKNLNEIMESNDVFHMNFDLNKQTEFGLVSNEDTYNFWKGLISAELDPVVRKRVLTEIHNGKREFSDWCVEFNEWLSSKIKKGDQYYVFERQLGFDRERFNMLYKFGANGSKPPLDHWRFADTRTWIRKSYLPNTVVNGTNWNANFEETFFKGFPHFKHHSVDDALIDGFMIKLLVQQGLTKL